MSASKKVAIVASVELRATRTAEPAGTDEVDDTDGVERAQQVDGFAVAAFVAQPGRFARRLDVEAFIDAVIVILACPAAGAERIDAMVVGMAGMGIGHDRHSSGGRTTPPHGHAARPQVRKNQGGRCSAARRGTGQVAGSSPPSLCVEAMVTVAAAPFLAQFVHRAHRHRAQPGQYRHPANADGLRRLGDFHRAVEMGRVEPVGQDMR